MDTLFLTMINTIVNILHQLMKDSLISQVSKDLQVLLSLLKLMLTFTLIQDIGLLQPNSLKKDGN